MEHLNKLLFHIENLPELFKEQDVGFILGLTNSQIKELKKFAISHGYIDEIQKQFFLTNLGMEYLQENPYKESEINLEYLKLEKTPSTVTRAIRNLAKHLLSGEELKSDSIEDYIKREIIDSDKFNRYKAELELQLLGNSKKRVLISDIQLYKVPKSVFAVLLLEILAKNSDKFAIYEKGQFILTLDYLVFDRMICSPQNFELQKVIAENNSLLSEISTIFLKEKTNNILEITKALYSFIKELDNYTLNTERLSEKTLRFKNVILNAKDPINLFYRDIPRVLSNKFLAECNDEFTLALRNAIKELTNAKSELSKDMEKFFLKTFRCKSRKELSERFEKIQEFINENELKILSKNIACIEQKRELWIDRIATFINKSRVPKDWKDSDVADFKLKVKELALKFFALESIAGDSNLVVSEKLNGILSEILSLEQYEKNIILRKMINE